MKARLPKAVLDAARGALSEGSQSIGDEELEATIWAGLDALLGPGREEIGIGFVEDLLRELRVMNIRVFDRRWDDHVSGMVISVYQGSGFRSTQLVPSLLEAVRDARALQSPQKRADVNEYRPTEVSPPGATIRDLLSMRKWTVEEFAHLSGLGVSFVQGLLTGSEVIDQVVARKLEKLGGTAMFWVRREAQYRASLQNKEAG